VRLVPFLMGSCILLGLRALGFRKWTFVAQNRAVDELNGRGLGSKLVMWDGNCITRVEILG
jgi:hypothetical protein